MEIDDLIVAETERLKQGLEALDRNGMGTLFIIDAEKRLKGIVTDGDIRRALLKNSSMETSLSSIMNKNFTSLPYNADNSQILAALSSRIKVIPLIDQEGRLIDYAAVNRIRRITVASPLLNGNELAYVTDCIKTGWISSQGKYVRKFEELFMDHHKGTTALAVCNGTVALHLALEALGICEGDEVLVPNLTFAASVNAILYTRATPILIDVDPETWTIDVEKARKKITQRTKAIMPVHLYGHPCDMDNILQLSKEFKLKVIEDCAEALGSEYDGEPVGVLGDAATFSFFGNKTITTGEGGMILFRDREVAEKAAMLRDHGMQKDRRYWHQEVGYNYRMTNLQAAVGVAQFERLKEFVDAKRRIASSYSATLRSFDYFITPVERTYATNSYWLYTFLVNEDAPFSRNDLMTFLGKKGIETRPVFFCMHEMPPYVKYGEQSDFRHSKKVSSSGISLPSSVDLSELELTHICNSIVEFCQR